jgi:diguanylate cyclase (GGDEF)-like protein
MAGKRLLILSQRKKFLFVIAATLSPIISFMLFVFLTSYRPVVKSLENIVEKTMSEIKPVARLQKTLLSAVMPPNDYLIHGSKEEIQEWKEMKSRVDVAFDVVFREARLESKHEDLVVIREEWNRSRAQGDQLFTIGKPAVFNRESADLMEAFDHNVTQISQQLSRLIFRIEEELQNEYRLIEKLKFRGLVLTGISILLGLLVGIAGTFRLTEERKKMVGLSLHDGLTGVYNRRALDREINRMKKHRLFYQPPYFTVLMMDLDEFKQVNDRYGHDVGDAVLKAFAELTGKMIRADDVFGRYGGEEFLLLLPETNKEEAAALAERIRRGVESARIGLPCGQGDVRITVSIGGATFSSDTDSTEDCIRAADQAMYEAKQQGRNRVVFA